MNKRCLIINFDFTKDKYSDISYSVASILAQLKKNREKYLEKINDYSFIAFAAYAWSKNLVNGVMKIIRPKFNGKIILGSYEITALRKEKLQVYPDVDFISKVMRKRL